jgi:hypothetical protein
MVLLILVFKSIKFQYLPGSTVYNRLIMYTVELAWSFQALIY